MTERRGKTTKSKAKNMDKHPESLTTDVPVIDLSLLDGNRHNRAVVIEKIRGACQTNGFFHVINHGIHDSVIEDALNVNKSFFEMTVAEKEELISEDIFKEVRFGHLKVGDYSREFLKLYAHPLENFISFWPSIPRDYSSIIISSNAPRRAAPP